jgi:GDPmannose 4,6-dehydratase
MPGSGYHSGTMRTGSNSSALITGVAGQDGIYLARHLLGLGYRVIGTVRPDSAVTATRAPYLDGVELHHVDLRDRDAFTSLLDACRPQELYNLAGFTSVGASWGQAELVAETNGMSVLRMLEELRAYGHRHGDVLRYFQPSSSEMFGVSDQQPQTEGTPHHPRSPYAATKSFAHHLTVNYRESYGLFTCTGTLYNHESPLRGPQFVTRKITQAVAEIALGRRESVTLGNLDVRRDWGSAADYARSMHLMLQQESAQDFIIATGVSRPLSAVLEVAFETIGVSDAEAFVTRDPALMRPADVPDLRGDPTKAREQLTWEPTYSFEDVIQHMVRVDIERLTTGIDESMSYLYP